MEEKLFITSESKLFIEMGVWDDETEKYRHEVHDVTHAGYHYFFLPCRFEEDVTLRHFLMLLKNYDDILGKLFAAFYYEEFMDYLLNSNYKDAKIEAIEFYEDITVNKKLKDAGSYKYVHLCGFPLTQEQIAAKSEPEKVHLKAGDIENFAFIGIKELNPDMKIRVKPKTNVYIQEAQSKIDETLIFDDYNGLTLMDIIHTLFWKFSFFGNMESQEKFIAELCERSEEIESGRAVTYKLEEIDGEMKLIGPNGEMLFNDIL